MPTTAALPHTRGRGAPKRPAGLFGGRTVHTARAFKLFLGGLVGGLIGTGICLVVFGIRSGSQGLATVGIAAGIVLFFYCVGQLVMVGFAEAGARTLLAASMASYTGRVVILGLVLLGYQKNRAAWPELDSLAFFVTAVAVVAGWLLIEMLVFNRLRIGVYDTEYESPSDDESEGGERHADSDRD